MAYEGAETTIGDLDSLYSRTSTAGPYETAKSTAVHLVASRNLALDCTPAGNGTKAYKRGLIAVLVAENLRFDEDTTLSPDDINRLAAIDDEMRTEAHKFPTPVNPHD